MTSIFFSSFSSRTYLIAVAGALALISLTAIILEAIVGRPGTFLRHRVTSTIDFHEDVLRMMEGEEEVKLSAAECMKNFGEIIDNCLSGTGCCMIVAAAAASGISIGGIIGIAVGVTVGCPCLCACCFGGN
jgi:hypothetical protein